MKRFLWLLPIAMIIGGTIANYFFSSAVTDSLNKSVQTGYPLMASSQSLVFDLGAIEEGFKNAVSASDKDGLQKGAEKAALFRAELASLAKIPGAAPLAADIKPLFDAYYSAAEQAAAMMLGVQTGDMMATATRMQNAQAALTAKLQATREHAKHDFEATIQASRVSSERGSLVNIVVTTIMLVSVLLSRLSVRAVLKEIGGQPAYAQSIVHHVAKGNLGIDVTLRDQDKTSLLFAMSGMQAQLSGIVEEVRASVDAMRTGAQDIAVGNINLASRTEQQAASLEETAATLGELTATVRKNAASAKEADKLATNASLLAGAGGAAVNEVVATMDGIQSSARKIVDIIAVIDGIAFQTNILALNAAVEAARAGEQGRGFAVVASEVRNLAQRSASAAKEIKELIGESVERVNAGSEQVRMAGDAMSDILRSVKLVNDIIAEISTASETQTLGIVQVNAAVSELDGVTQENSAMVDAAASSAARLEEIAERVAGAVSVFRLRSDQAVAAPAAEMRARAGNRPPTRALASGDGKSRLKIM